MEVTIAQAATILYIWYRVMAPPVVGKITILEYDGAHGSLPMSFVPRLSKEHPFSSGSSSGRPSPSPSQEPKTLPDYHPLATNRSAVHTRPSAGAEPNTHYTCALAQNGSARFVMLGPRSNKQGWGAL